MKTIDDFRKEVELHYTGESFEVTVDRDPTPNSTGNGISYRSLYSILVCLNQNQTSGDLEAFKTCLELREVGGPGLYNRNPGDKSRNAIDDLMYAAAASCMIDSQRLVARAILNHYRVHRGIFKDQLDQPMQPGDWLGRYFWFYGFLQLCAGERPSWYDRLFIMADLFCSPDRDNAGGILMHWCRARIFTLAGGVVGSMAKSKLRKLSAVRPQGLAAVCAEYFNRKGDEPHPFSWIDVWHEVET